MSLSEGLIVEEYVPFIWRDGVRGYSRSHLLPAKKKTAACATAMWPKGHHGSRRHTQDTINYISDSSLSFSRITVVDKAAAPFAYQNLHSDIDHSI